MALSSEYRSRLLAILREIISICENNGLMYFLTGGSLLGAVRHHGIIPWDDDIDIAMPRKDYEKFKSILMNSSFDNIEVGTYEVSDDYYLTFVKLFDKHSTLVEYEEPFYLGGIFVDVFPLDLVPDDFLEREKFLKKYYFYRDILGRINTDWSKLKWNFPSMNTVKKINGIITKFFFERYRNRIIKKLDLLARQYENEDYSTIINLCGAWRLKEMGRKEIFSDYKLVDFDGMKVRIPIGFDEYLTNIYGDYMTPPPENKRESHHSYFYLNMNKRVTKEYIFDTLN